MSHHTGPLSMEVASPVLGGLGISGALSLRVQHAVWQAHGKGNGSVQEGVVAWQGMFVHFSGNFIQRLACRLITAVVTFSEQREKQAGLTYQKTGNVPENALSHGLECSVHLSQLFCSGLKAFNSCP